MMVVSNSNTHLRKKIENDKLNDIIDNESKSTNLYKKRKETKQDFVGSHRNKTNKLKLSSFFFLVLNNNKK
jgi:hypothetical protein